MSDRKKQLQARFNDFFKDVLGENINLYDKLSTKKFVELKKVISCINNIITLQRENGLCFDFKIIDIYENNVTIAPILPLLGEGGFIYTTKYIDKDEIYLINQFDN